MAFRFTLAILIASLAKKSTSDCSDTTGGCFPSTENVAQMFTATSTCGNPRTLHCPPEDQSNSDPCFFCDATMAVNTSFHPEELAVDRNFSTFWQSATKDTELIDIVTVQVNLSGSFQLEKSVVTFHTYRPLRMILEKSNDYGATWTALQYYAPNCGVASGADSNFSNVSTIPDSDLPNEDNNTQAFCITRDSTGLVPVTGGEVTYDVALRYGNNRFDLVAIVNHTLVTNLRVRFRKLATRGDELVSSDLNTFAAYYYAIEEWTVDARCYCYGHSNECMMDGDKITSECVCKGNTAGANCERCLPLFNNKPYMRGNSTHTNPCEECQCNNHSDSCTYNETKGFGVCNECQHNTMGDMCDQCLPNFFRDAAKAITDPYVCKDCATTCFSAGTESCNASGCACHPNVVGDSCADCTCGFGKIDVGVAGCELCDCDVNGTLACSGGNSVCGADRVQCDKISGNCTCKTNVMGAKCDTCKDEFYGLSCSESDGCLACGCSLLTATSLVCDKATGQCPCKTGLTGRTCGQVQPGFFMPGLEGIVYEGERAELMGAEAEAQTVQDPAVFSGPGCARFRNDGDKATFSLQVPARTIRYRVIVRYQADANTDAISFTLSRTATGSYTCNPGGTQSSQQLFVTSTTLLSTDDTFDLNAGVGFCLNANETIVLEVLQSTAGATWCLDSVVLMPVQDDIIGPVTNGDFDLELAFGDCYTDRPGFGPSTDPTCLQFTIQANAWLFGGAIECGCFENGTYPSSNGTCDQFHGTCTCRANVVSEAAGKCTLCKDEFFGLSGDNAVGCSACSCSSVAATSLVCEKEAGQCSCVNGFDGRTCNEVMSGYYIPNLEGIIYEGEEANLTGGSIAKARTPTDPPSFSGRGCAHLKDAGNKATFVIQVPQQTIRYRVIVRYLADENTDSVSFAIRRTGTNTYSCPSGGSVTGQQLDTTSHTFTSAPTGGIVDLEPAGLCLEKNTTIFVDAEVQTSGETLCLDSIIVMPLSDDIKDVATGGDFDLELDYDECYNDRDNGLVPIREVCKQFAFKVNAWLFQTAFECECDGTGSNNSLTCESFGGQCSCIGNVVGRTCSDCASQFFNLTYAGCQACNCSEEGSEPSCPCDAKTGICVCKENIVGDKCDRCAPTFFNFSSCDPCNCSSLSSTSQQCGAAAGNCSCKPGVQGLKCDGGCQDEFFNLTSSGCEPCVCSPVGRQDSVCNKTSGQCNCIANVTGIQCDQCDVGFFGFDHFDGIACQKCFCYGHATEKECQLATVPTEDVSSSVTSTFDTSTEDWGGIDDAGFDSIDPPSQSTILGGSILEGFTDSGMEFFTAPAKFLGNQKAAYGQQLTFKLAVVKKSSSVADPSLSVGADGDVKLRSGNESIFHSFLNPPPVASSAADFGSFSIEITLANFKINDEGTVRSVTKGELMSVLENLQHLQIRAQFGQGTSRDFFAGLDEVVLNKLERRPTLETINEENCTCNTGHEGLSCQMCQSGFKREVVNGNESIPCIPCECNNHSSMCNVSTGVCANCGDNTIGDFCEECSDEFFGNATFGGSCEPCACDGEGSNSSICDKTSGQCSCIDGFSGRKCDVCKDGRFNKAEGCLACDCNVTNTVNASNVCMKSGGQCPCVQNVAGRTCDVCRPGLIGAPPTCVDCGQCFSNWTALIAELVDKAHTLASHFDALVLNQTDVNVKLKDFLECVKMKIVVTEANVEECIMMVYSDDVKNAIDASFETLMSNVTALRSRLSDACATLNVSDASISSEMQRLNETVRVMLETKQSQLYALLMEIEKGLNETDEKLALARSFNGSVMLTSGNYTDAEKLTAIAEMLNSTATNVYKEACHYRDMVETNKSRITVAETMARNAQSLVNSSAEKADHAKSLTADATKAKESFDALFQNNSAKLNDLKGRRDSLKSDVEMYLERAKNATAKALKANGTAEQSGRKTQDKYMAATADKTTAESLKTNATDALDEATIIYEIAKNESDVARGAYETANSTLADAKQAKEQLEGAVTYMMEAEKKANETLDVTLPSVEEIRSLSKKINDSIVPQEEIDAVEDDANASVARATAVQQLASSAAEISQKAADLVDDIQWNVGNVSEKKIQAEQTLNDTMAALDEAKMLKSQVEQYSDTVHAISQEAKAIAMSALNTTKEADMCRRDAIKQLNSTLAIADTTCSMGIELRSNLSAVFVGAFDLGVNTVLADANTDKADADELLSKASDHLNATLAAEMDKLLGLLDEVKNQKERLMTQRTEVAEIESRVIDLQKRAEEQCSLV